MPRHHSLNNTDALCRCRTAILWSRIPNLPLRVSSWCTHWCVKVFVILYVLIIQADEEVPVPSDYGLPYEDLPLITPDGITLRCYLLPLKKSLSTSHSDLIKPEMVADFETDDEVRVKLARATADLKLIGICSSPQADPL
jgi:hypothetical protein